MNYIILNGSEPLQISEKQAALFEKLLCESEARALKQDLNLLFELALFSSEQPIDKREKEALYTIKTLSENLNV